MGIQGLLPLLKSVTKKVHIESFAGEAVAIDAYSWLHKGVYSCVADLYHQRPTKAFVEYCVGRIKLLRQYKINPIMVFDGGFLPMKAYREEQRAQQRLESKRKAKEYFALNAQTMHMSTAAMTHMSKSMDVTPEMAFMLIEALRQEKVEFIVAPYEADAQMAYLDRIGRVSAIISEDSDLLLFGCRRVLFKMDKFGHAEEVSIDRLVACEEMDLRGFGMKEFRQMCIISGCDYLPPLGGLGIKTLHKFFLKYKTLDRVLYALRREANKVIGEEYERELVKAELTFQHQRVFCPEKRTLVSLHPLPADIHSVLDIETDLVFDNLDFLGPLLPDDIAVGIAEGRLNPMTLRPFQSETDDEAATEDNMKQKPQQASANIRDFFQKRPNPAFLEPTSANHGASRLTVKRPYTTASSSTEYVKSVQQTLQTRFQAMTSLTELVDNGPKYMLTAGAVPIRKSHKRPRETLKQDDTLQPVIPILQDQNVQEN